MIEFFLDSSAIFASVDRDNVAFPNIKSFLRDEQRPMVTTNLVFAESISLITKRLGKKTGVEAGGLLLQSNLVRLVFLNELIQREAWKLYVKYKDKDFDLIDATSFVFCQKNKIKEVLTLDHHFTQMGFKIVP